MIEPTATPPTPASQGYIYSNGVLLHSSNMQNFAGGVSRVSNSIGSNYLGTSNFYSGDIVEIIIHNRSLSPKERQDIESYLLTKYQLVPQTIPPVVFFPASGATLPNYGFSQVALTAPDDIVIHYTTGSTVVNAGSPVYTGPILPNVHGTFTLNVLPVINGYPFASSQSASYTVP